MSPEFTSVDNDREGTFDEKNQVVHKRDPPDAYIVDRPTRTGRGIRMRFSNSQVFAKEGVSCIRTSKINNEVSSMTDGGDMLINSYQEIKYGIIY